MRILLVEDERRMALAVRKGLAEEGHVVELAVTGPDAVAVATGSEFDVVVLDVMLPGFDGVEVARRIRAAGVATPVIMLTARDAVRDVVNGLDAGADDYLTKPFAFEVLLARIGAVARRAARPYSSVLRVGVLALDPARREARCGDRMLTLTRTEFALLEYLMRRTGRVVSRDALIDGVWGYDCHVGNNTLDVFISGLRHKLEGCGAALIETVRGVGYRIAMDSPGPRVP